MDHRPEEARSGRDDAVASAYAQVEAALTRALETVRRMSPGRLRGSLAGPYATRVDAARMLARTLMIAGQGMEEAAAAAMPVWRSLPDVPELVVGDQLAVMAHDLLTALPDAPAEVWTADGRAPLGDVVRDVLATVQEVQRLL